MIPNWKEILKNASIEKKKMILASIIKKIVVYDEKIDIHLKINFEEFIKNAKKLDIDVKKNIIETRDKRRAEQRARGGSWATPLGACINTEQVKFRVELAGALYSKEKEL